jgi:phosphatidylethanolamine-binding protein (PEBP) family uncharacterized protein
MEHGAGQDDPGKIPKRRPLLFQSEPCKDKTISESGYNGPCPPRGQTYHFFFNVYAPDTDPPLAAGATKEQLEKAMEGYVVHYGETYVTGRR